MLNYYCIINSSNLYKDKDILKSSMIANDNNILDIYKEAAKHFIPAILKVNIKNNMIKTAFTDPELVALIDPKELSIDDKMASMAYQIYTANNEYIVNKISKVAKDLSVTNKDLSDYLNIVLKFAKNIGDDVE